MSRRRNPSPGADPGLEWVRWLYVEYGYTVHQRCLRRLGSVPEADDALHDVFTRVLRHRASFHGERPLAWLIRISDRVCYDRWRRRGAEERPIDQSLYERVASGQDVDDVERAILIAQLAAGSSPPVREVGVLYYVEDMTQEEIASVLHCSRKSVRTRLAAFNRWVKKRISPSPGGVS